MDMMTRRRAMMGAEAGEPAPLYSFPTRTSGVYDGTGGNTVIFNQTNTNGYAFCAVVKGTQGTSSAEYKRNVTWFTIPAGAHVVMTVKILNRTGTLNTVAFYVRTTSSGTLTAAISKPSGSTVGETYTTEKDFEAETNVSEFGVSMNKSGGGSKIGLEVTLTVNGIRYV